MSELDVDTDRLVDSSDLHAIILKFENNPSKYNPQALVHLIVKIICDKPNLVDENCRKMITKYFQTNSIRANGLASIENLTTLQKTEYPLLTWLKYENLLIHLIKGGVYEPKTLASEVLALVKDEMDPNISVKFCSVLGACVKHCRNINNPGDEEEKWSEIIDWISWFLATEDEDFS